MAAPRGVRVLRTFACALAPRGCIPARGVRYGPRSDIFLSSRRASSEATATASASRGDDHDPADLADRTLSQAPQEPVTSASSSPADSSDLHLRSLPSQPITPPNPSTISSPFAEPSTTRAGDTAASPLVTATATAAAQERLVALRAQLAGHSRNLADNAAKQLTLLGLRINEVTGYREVEALKDLVAERGERGVKMLRRSSTHAADAGRQNPSCPNSENPLGPPKSRTTKPSPTAPLPSHPSTPCWNANTPGPTLTFPDSRPSFGPTTRRTLR
jgi:hypothetical protein